MRYAVHRDGQQYGPYTLDELRRYFDEGFIAPTDDVGTEGTSQRISVEEFLRASHAAPADSPASAGAGINASPIAAPPTRVRIRWRLWAGIGAAALVIVLALAILVPLLSGPKPEDSIDQLRLAYLNRDQDGFDKYVDVRGVLDDWVDQSVRVWLSKSNANPLAALAVQTALPTLKAAFLPNAAHAIDQFVVSGTVIPSGSGAENANPVGSFLAGYLASATHELAASGVSYLGVESRNITGNAASLIVKLSAPSGVEPIRLKVRMQRMEDHWRVVAVEDVFSVLQQLSGGTGQGNAPDVVPVSAPGDSGVSRGDAAPSTESSSPPSDAPASPPPTSTASAEEVPYPGDASASTPATDSGTTRPKNTWDTPADDPFGGDGGFIRPAASQSQDDGNDGSR